jgi:peptidase E
MSIAVVKFSFFNRDIHNALEYTQNYGWEFEQKIYDIYSRYGIDDIMFIDYYSSTHEDAKEIIDECDIVIFPGGAPDEFMDRLREFGLDDKRLYESKIVIGSSAGAMIQLDLFHITPDGDYSFYQEHQGLGLINNFKIEVHYVKRFRTYLSIKKVYKKYHLPIYLVPDGSGLIVDNHQVTRINKVTCYNPKKYGIS